MIPRGKFSLLILLLFLFITPACSTTPQPAQSPQLKKTEKFQDLFMNFEEFKEKYNNFIIENKTDYMYMILDENTLQPYGDGTFFVCKLPYTTMKVFIDSETKNINRLEVYSAYSNNNESERKNIFSSQKWIFLSSANILLSKMEDKFSKINESEMENSEILKIETLIRDIKNEVNELNTNQFENYNWNANAVSMKISTEGSHIDEDTSNYTSDYSHYLSSLMKVEERRKNKYEPIKKGLEITFEEFKNKYNANVQKDSYALGEFLIRDENIQYTEDVTMCILPYVVMALDIDKNNGYIKNIVCYSEGSEKLASATVYSLAATVFDAQWDNKTYRQDKMKTLLFGSGRFTDKNIKYYKIEQGNAIMLVIQLEE